MSYQAREDIDDMIMELREEKESDFVVRSRIEMRNENQKHIDEINKYEERLKSLQLELNTQKTGRKAEQAQWSEKKKAYESKIESMMNDLSTLLDQQQFRDQHIESLKNTINSLYRDHIQAKNELQRCKSKLQEYEKIIRNKDLNTEKLNQKDAHKKAATNKDSDDLFSTFYLIYDYINEQDPLVQPSDDSTKESEETVSQQELDLGFTSEPPLEPRYCDYVENRNPVENCENANQPDGLTYHYEQQLAKKDRHIALLKHSMESIRREHEFLSSELLKIRMREITHKATYKYHKGDVLSLQYFKHGNEKYLATASLDKGLKIWMPAKNNPDNVVSKLISSIKIRALTFFTMDDTLFLACGGSSPYKIEVWNVKEKRLEYVLRGHSGHVNSLLEYEDQDHHYLISASADTSIKIWDLDTRTCVRTVKAHEKDVGSLALYSYRKRLYLASGSDDNTIKLFNLNNSCQCICTLIGHSSSVRCLSFFSKNGKMHLASGAYDTTIMIWNLVDNVLEATLNGHSDKVYYMTAFYNNNKPCLLSGGNDRTIRLWDLGTYTQIVSLNVPSSLPVWSLSVDNDEEENTWNLISGHGGGSVMLWSLPEKFM